MLLERIVNGRAKSNTYVYAPDDAGRHALIVDAGFGAADKVTELVEAEGLRPQALVLTHGHADHIWTARRLCERFEIGAYIHTTDVSWFVDVATGGNMRIARVGGRFVSRARRIRPKRLDGFEDGARLVAGDLAVEVLHTPGHSGGSACFLVDGLCFSGDTVMRGNIGQTAFPGGDREALRRSIGAKLLPLPDDARLLPGHGRETTVGAERGLWNEFTRGNI